MTTADDLKARQFWQENATLGRTARIVAVAEKHVMFRYKGDGMRLCGVADFMKKHHRVFVAAKERKP